MNKIEQMNCHILFKQVHTILCICTLEKMRIRRTWKALCNEVPSRFGKNLSSSRIWTCDPVIRGERGGSVVECRTLEREVRGSRPTSAVLCPWARHFSPQKYWLITQEAMAPSRHDWKIVDRDVKPQHNQPTGNPKLGPLGSQIWGLLHHHYSVI